MPEKVTYEREAKSLTENDVDSAISYSRSGKIIGKVAEWRDSKTVGLTIRIIPRKTVWFVRRREITIRLGTLRSSLNSATSVGRDRSRYCEIFRKSDPFGRQTKTRSS